MSASPSTESRDPFLDLVNADDVRAAGRGPEVD